MSNVMHPCPICKRKPIIRQVGYVRKGSYAGYSLFYYVISCKPLWGLFGTHLSTKQKGVAAKDPWYRWKQDLIEEWNALACTETKVIR